MESIRAFKFAPTIGIIFLKFRTFAIDISIGICYTHNHN